MLRSTVAQFLRRWRSKNRYFSSASQIDFHPTLAMEKISDSFAGFCLRATLYGVGGYVLGGLATTSISAEELETEKSVINLHRYADRSERSLQKLEKSIQKDQLKWDEIDRGKTPQRSS